jgi:hypothetical protein
MYCGNCGMHNEAGDGACILCERPLDPSFAPPEEKIFIDVTKFAFIPLCKELLRSKAILLPLVFPIMVLSYAVHKLTKRPFLSLAYTCQSPKLHRVDLGDFPTLNTKSIKKIHAALLQIGFEPVMDAEDRSREQVNLERIYINRGFGAFAAMFIGKATGRVLYVDFFAFTKALNMVSYINGDGISENDDPRFIILYLGPITVEKTWKLFTEALARRGEALLVPEPRRLFPILNLVRIARIDHSLAKKILIKPIGTAAQGKHSYSLCYHHPTALAIRACATCGMPLCETCYKEVNGAYYCHRCAPAETTSRKLVEAPWGFVGMGPRTLAAGLDLLVAAVVIVAGYLLLYFPAKALVPSHWHAFAFVAIQPFVAGFIFWYFIFQVARKGQTFGKKIAGLHIIGRNGEFHACSSFP